MAIKNELEKLWLGPHEEFSDKQLDLMNDFVREIITASKKLEEEYVRSDGAWFLEIEEIGEAIEKIILVATKSPACGGWGISTEELKANQGEFRLP